MKNGILLFIFLILYSVGISQDIKAIQGIFNELKQRDSLLFSLGYNLCDTTQFRNLISDDFEFYHDKDGFLNSKEAFIQSIPNLCKMNYRATRVLVKGSLEVFPLYNNGLLYGAVQNGIHEFYGEEVGKPKYLTSTAKFTHVWILESGNWKLKRILSFDHEVPLGNK